MRTYVIKRLLLMIPTLVGMTLLVYGIVRLAPGDPIEAMIRNQSGNIDPKAMRESADRIRERLGLNDLNFWGDDAESLLPHVENPDLAARVRAAAQLTRVAAARARPAPPVELGARAAAELKRITGLDINQAPEPWEAWADAVRKILADLESLEGDDPAARAAAADELRKVIGYDLSPGARRQMTEDARRLLASAEPFIPRLRSPDEAERAQAALDLRCSTGCDFTADPVAWRAWWSANRYTFGKRLIDPAERVMNVFYGYARWVGHLARGDFGESIVFKMPKNSPVVDRLLALRAWGEKYLGLRPPDMPAPADAPAADGAVPADAPAPIPAAASQDAPPAREETRLTIGQRIWQAVEDLRTGGSRNPLWIMADRIPVTVTLNIIAEALIFLIAIPVGLVAARHRGRWFDRASSFVLLALYSIPVILAGSLLLAFLARGGVGWGLFPVAGLHGTDYEKMAYGPYLLDLLWHAALPVACMVYGGLAYLAKLGRASLLENLRADYVRTARAKGLPERRVVYVHALRNSLLPMITVMVLALPGLLGGSIIVETIFSIQGTGLLFYGAAQAYDLSVLMAETLFYGFLTLLFLLVGDMLYAWADPRVRYE
ncbi:MAG: ABC transporter permease subunit [Planctomycetes bacterium]|nr:ABC transporter permease subunit [Planctomycetota bacterium]